MFLTSSYKNRKIYDTNDSLFLSSHFIYECVTNINHIKFKRGENSLSIHKKLFLSKRVHRRDIRLDILHGRFIEKVQTFSRLLLVSNASFRL
jgi:hypothetical protein